MHMIKLFLQIVRLRFFAKLAYPGAYLTGIVAQWLSYGIEVLLTAVMVATFGALAGWSAVEVIFLYGVWLLTYAIGASFTFNIANLLPEMAVSGTLDEALTRPVPTLFYLIATNFNVGYVSHIALSVGVIAWSAGQLSVHWDAGQWAWLVALVLCGAVITGSLLLLCELPALRLRARSPLRVLFFEGREFAKYPLAIYPQSLQLLFTSALPFGFVAYYPLSALLGKGGTLDYLSPVVAAALAGITALCWQLTIRRYESAGT